MVKKQEISLYNPCPKIRLNTISGDDFDCMCKELIENSCFEKIVFDNVIKTRRVKDDGWDIYAEKRVEDVTENWAFQCKNWEKIGFSDIKKEFDDFYERNEDDLPDYYVFILACDPTIDTIKKSLKHIREKIRDVKIWDKNKVESAMRKAPDIAGHYYGEEVKNALTNQKIKIQSEKVHSNNILRGTTIEENNDSYNRCGILLESLQEEINKTKSENIKKIYKDRLEIAQRLFKSGKIEAARTIYLDMEKEVEEKDEELLFKLYNNIAATYINSKHEEKAVNYLNKACQLDEIKGKLSLAYIYLIKKEYHEGLKVINEFLNIEPENQEAIRLKANFLIYLGFNEEAISLFNEQVLESNENYFSLGWVYQQSGDFENALKCYEKSFDSEVNNGIVYFALGSTLLMKMETKIKKEFKISVDNETLNVLKKAENYLTKSIELLSEINHRLHLSYAYLNLGVLNFIEEKYEKAIENLKFSIKLNPDSSSANKNLGVTLANIKKFSESVIYIEKALELGDKDSEILLPLIYIDNGDPEKAINFLDKYIEFPPGEILNEKDVHRYVTYYLALKHNLQIEAAIDLIEFLYSRFPNDFMVLREYIKHKRNVGEIQEAIEILKNVINKNQSNYLNEMKLQLADIFYCENGSIDYLKATQIYEEFLNTEKVNIILVRHIRALFNSNQIDKCLYLCQELRKKHGVIDVVATIEFNIYQRIDEIDKAIDLIEKLCKKYPDRPDFKIILSKLYFRNGMVKQSYSLVKSEENKCQGNFEDLIHLSQLYLNTGDRIKAIKIAFKALEKAPHISLTYKNYILMFLTNNDLEGLDKKYIVKFNECMNEYENKFPNDLFIKKFKTEEFESTIDEIKDVQEKVLAEKVSAPISHFAKIFGRSIFEIWISFLNDPHREIKAFTGTDSDLEAELYVINKTSEIILCPVALFTFAAIDKLNLLEKAFDKIYICRSLIDEINAGIIEKEIKSEGNQKVIWKENGKIYRYEIGKEEIVQLKVFLQKVIDFIKTSDSVEIIGKSPKRIKYFNEIKENVLRSTYDTLEEAANRNLMLLSDEMEIREILRRKRQVYGFCSITLLKYLSDQNKITIEDYYDLLSKLAYWNYSFIPVDGKMLFNQLKKHNFIFNSHSKRLIVTLRQKEQIVSNAVGVALDFIKELWTQKVPTFKRTEWLDFILSCLFYKRDTKAVVPFIMKELYSYKFHLIDLQANDIENNIRLWLKSNSEHRVFMLS